MTPKMSDGPIATGRSFPRPVCHPISGVEAPWLAGGATA
jgi:hypothetical protein